MAYFSVDIGADDVLEKLQDDGHFAEEFWRGLAGGLDAGSLLDDAVDILDGLGDDHKLHFVASLRKLADAVEGRS
ncbi:MULTISPECIES: hypothetical protein [Paracoccus]|uniref:hypothetical protein n=1 Tax=Paracoccus TaxID=265 RepID=UPI00086BDA4E|nr:MULTISPECIES: hypothetical protein [Paracoccus]ODT60990.1 MAG: hypothetical protein ABS73_03895 [Paracoccus sp. SCN 68-21]